MQKKKIKKFDIYNKILNQPKIEGICQYICWTTQILKARMRAMLIRTFYWLYKNILSIYIFQS